MGSKVGEGQGAFASVVESNMSKKGQSQRFPFKYAVIKKKHFFVCLARQFLLGRNGVAQVAQVAQIQQVEQVVQARRLRPQT